MQESRFSSINVQSARERLNPQATSARGHVIVAQGSATPESGCSLTNSCTDDDIDKRSVDFDGAVHMYAMRQNDSVIGGLATTTQLLHHSELSSSDMQLPMTCSFSCFPSKLNISDEPL